MTCTSVAGWFNIYSQLVMSAVRIADINDSIIVISLIRLSEITNSNFWYQQFSINADMNDSNPNNRWYHYLEHLWINVKLACHIGLLLSHYVIIITQKRQCSTFVKQQDPRAGNSRVTMSTTEVRMSNVASIQELWYPTQRLEWWRPSTRHISPCI